jgi:hypothetical protein
MHLYTSDTSFRLSLSMFVMTLFPAPDGARPSTVCEAGILSVLYWTCNNNKSVHQAEWMMRAQGVKISHLGKFVLWR